MIRHNINKRIVRIGESAKDFSLELYDEHLSQISYYYDQLRIEMDERHDRYPGVELAEKKINAHIQALIADERTAMDYCRTKAENGEPGIVYAWVRLFCHHRWNEKLRETLKWVPA